MTVPQPKRVAELNRAISVLAAERGTTVKRVVSLVANVALAQMLPETAVKGGTGLKLRFGERITRDTPDLDTAYRGDMAAFEQLLAKNLAVGWGGFTGTVVMRAKRSLAAVPTAYVMQPFRVTLKYAGKTFKAVDLEVGWDELEATGEDPEYALADDVIDVFSALGLQTPNPVRVQPLHHQIAQKIHACTEPDSDRARDLVDMQIMASDADKVLVAKTARRLFSFRQQHNWPPTAKANSHWDALYIGASEGLNVIADVDDAVTWLNNYIANLDETLRFASLDTC